MEQKNESRKEKTVILGIIILIILFIIIFLLIRCLGKIDHNHKIPTGNVDIFDIVFDSSHGKYCHCTGQNNSDKKVTYICEICKGQKVTVQQNGGSSTSTTVVGGVDEDKNSGTEVDKDETVDTEETKPGLVVYDKDKQYAKQTPLNIFSNVSYYVVDDLIAPESENSYQFVIRNDNEFNIKYDLKMLEENKFDINMKFRLKMDGKYVVGNDNEYVTADKLDQLDLNLASLNYHTYTLDWKWFESDNDTEIGTNIEANYKLNLEVSAVQQ